VSKLILTRKESSSNKDSVLIHQDGNVLVKINVAKVSGKSVKLAFESFDNIVSIDREELYDKKYLSE
jgi:sRNA-binding carbon storage regulator CsrA